MFPLTIIRNQLIHHFEEARQVLLDNQNQLMFPIDHFLWNGFMAIIVAQEGSNEYARELARAAVEAAEIKRSGLAYHQDIGLVGKEYEDLVKTLVQMCLM